VIVAAGLTPAWQQILTFDFLNVGHVNRAQSALWCASGKVLNVGAALHQLRTESLTICPIGGATGELIRTDFSHRGVPAQWIPTQSATRVCTTLIDTKSSTTTELVENSTSLTQAELTDYVTRFSEVAREADVVVMSGSLPQGTPASFFRELMERSRRPAILDIRGKELLECLPLKPLLVKPNREELAATIGRQITTEVQLLDAMSEVRDRGAEWIVISNGGQPVLAMGPDGLHRLQPPKVKVLNPIGCGDSMTAAIAARIQRGDSPLGAIQFAIEYAACKASILYPVLPLDEITMDVRSDR
jgi:tagatose 6-phosphate kinase